MGRSLLSFKFPSFLLFSIVLASSITTDGSSQSILQQYLFSPEITATYGARCLDGSPAGYYFAPGNGSGITSYVIFLEGGGFCADVASCSERAKTSLGSSKYWPSTEAGFGIIDSSSVNNPNFYNFNRVYVLYCSGDVYAGTRDTVVDPNAFPFYFSGHRIITAVMDALLNTTDIGKADNVIFAGSSAGGIGCLTNADFVKDRLGSHVKTFLANPQGGWFFPSVVNYTAFVDNQLGPPYAGESPYFTELFQPYVNANCAAQNNITFCQTINNAYPYIQTPLFIAENAADSNQIFGENGCPTTNSTEVIAYINYYIQQMRSSLQQVLNSKNKKPINDGLFFPTCVAHTENTDVGSNTTINGFHLTTALGAWFLQNNQAPTRLEDSCTGINCNPSCPPLPFQVPSFPVRF